jgi:hypothetical protein
LIVIKLIIASTLRWTAWYQASSTAEGVLMKISFLSLRLAICLTLFSIVSAWPAAAFAAKASPFTPLQLKSLRAARVAPAFTPSARTCPADAPWTHLYSKVVWARDHMVSVYIRNHDGTDQLAMPPFQYVGNDLNIHVGDPMCVDPTEDLD